MRIEFVHPQREALAWSGSPLRLGSGDDNDLVLAAPGVAARHLSLHQDARGLVLEVAPGAGRVYVNARPVRERALLRAGDSLGVGEARLRLCADAPRQDRDDAEQGVWRPLAVSVRALAGAWSGRAWSLGRQGLALGRDGHLPLGLPAAAAARLRFHWRGAALWVQAEACGEHLLYVNGHVCEAARLHHGDQIGVGAHRFVIDASQLDRREPASAPAPQALPEAAAGPRGEVWWLIMTAAVLALAIALVLLVKL